MTPPTFQGISAASRQLMLRVNGPLTGVPGGRASGVPGPGMSFAGYRDYQFGDDVRLIDWNVFARQCRPSIKVFHRDSASQFLFVADVSASMRLPDPRKYAVAAEALSLLAMLASGRGDKVGCAAVSDRVEATHVPRFGGRHLRLVVSSLLQGDAQSTGTNMEVALAHAAIVLRRPGALVLASDCFDGAAVVPRWVSRLAALRRHRVTVLVVSSALDRDVPDVGLVDVLDVESGRRQWVDTHAPHVRQAFARRAARRRRDVLQAIRRVGADAVEVWCDRPLVPQLATLVSRRGRL